MSTTQHSPTMSNALNLPTAQRPGDANSHTVTFSNGNSIQFDAQSRPHVLTIQGLTYAVADVEHYKSCRRPAKDGLNHTEAAIRKILRNHLWQETISPHKWEEDAIYIGLAFADVVPTVAGAPKATVLNLDPVAVERAERAATNAGKAEAAPQQAEIPEFDYESALKLQRAAQPAIRDGSLHGTFEQRVLVTWMDAYGAYCTAGVDPQAANSAAFTVTVLNRALDEERDFWFNLFQAQFGYDCKVKKSDFAPVQKRLKAALPKGDVIHEALLYLFPLVEAGVPVWNFGPAGCGKSYGSKQVASVLGRKFSAPTGSTQSEIYDVIGSDVLTSDGNATVTAWRDGVLTEAVRNGYVLNMDEITLYNPSVHAEMHGLLTGEPLTIKQTGESIPPHVEFAIMVNDNTRGLGEDPQYVGTRPVNAAFRDRFAFIAWESMDHRTALAALKSEARKRAARRGWTVS